MTARVSCASPAAFHIWPEVRIIGRHRGVDDDVARHVQVGDAPVGVDHGQRRALGEALRRSPASMASRCVSGSFSMAGEERRRARRRAPMPAARASSPYSAKTSGKKAFTAWPKMIGSETFIIVALRWSENSTPSALASAICAA